MVEAGQKEEVQSRLDCPEEAMHAVGTSICSATKNIGCAAWRNWLIGLGVSSRIHPKWAGPD